MTEGQTILNRAWNHLWLDSEDTRQLGLENIVLMHCYRLASPKALEHEEKTR